MESDGIILNYHARLDPKKIGQGLTSIVSITLSNHDEKNAEKLRLLLSRLPNVLAAYALTGDMDYLIVVVSNDLDELSEFINQSLLPHDAVQNVKTSIALETIKSSSCLPISMN